MSLRNRPLKKQPSEIDYLKDIRASNRRLEAGQKRLEGWMNFHKGEHKSSARHASITASIVATVIMIAVEYFK